METFGQYAATRLIAEYPAQNQASTHNTPQSIIQAWTGVDLSTGMPVIIYLMTGIHTEIPVIRSVLLPLVLAQGHKDEDTYVVLASAPGYTALEPIVPLTRLNWLVRVSAQALAQAHNAQLIHGHLRPGHFWARGDQLFLEGFSLPWAIDPSGSYRPPEGQHSFAADIFSWARSMQAFGKGDPQQLLDGELGRLLGHCLNSKPSERPTAPELVSALESFSETSSKGHPSNSKPSLDKTKTSLERTQSDRDLDATASFNTDFDSGPPVNKGEAKDQEEPSKSTSLPSARAIDPVETVEIKESIPKKRTPNRSTSSTHNATPVVSEEDELLVPTIQRRISKPIRIGWDEDDSWRRVQIPPPPPRSSVLLPTFAIALVVVLLVLAGVFLWPRLTALVPAPQTGGTTTSTMGFIVTFKLDPPTTRTGRLTALEVPPNSGLKAGDVLATVPGPVLFPIGGTYRLKIFIEGLKAKEFDLEVHQDDEVVLKLNGQ